VGNVRVLAFDSPLGSAGHNRRRPGRNRGDFLFKTVVGAFAVLIVVVLADMVLEMTRASHGAIGAFGWQFLVSTDWDPVREKFGALPFIFGTIVSSLLGLLLAVPISIGSAIWLSELAPAWLKTPAGFLIELLAAVPSVVYGLWGVFVLCPFLRNYVEPVLASHLGFLPFFRGTHQGFGLLAGGVILAIMVTPTITSVSREVMRSVPNVYREGSVALGATRTEMVQMAVLPFARSGIVGAIILGLGRALGETMAITMVIGNRAEISWSLFSPSYTMASVIANEFTEATGDVHLAALAEIGLLLFGVTLVLNIVARLLVWKVSKVAV
jgi:phosphate transport system permease protein